MPAYSYICSKCGREFEYFYQMGDTPQHPACEKCNGVLYRLYKHSVIVPHPTHPARKGRGKG
jgi:putative FmdB family regulatory protein